MDWKLDWWSWIPRPLHRVLAITSCGDFDSVSAVVENAKNRCQDKATDCVEIKIFPSTDEAFVKKKRSRRSRRGGRRRNKFRATSEPQVAKIGPSPRNDANVQPSIATDGERNIGDGNGRRNRGRAYRRECRNRIKELWARSGSELPDGLAEKTWELH